jgi:fermentation-respiration switch protein FrsA (DUF1100 family)
VKTIGKVVKWTGGAVLLGYAAICIALYSAQRTLVFPVLANHVQAAAAGFPEAQETKLVTADGEQLVAWYVAPKGDKPLFVYFHGNGDTLSWRVGRDRQLVANGAGLLAVSYRGFEGSTGTPSEAGFHLDADAAYEFAAARVAPEQIITWGHSLGTGVAVRLAAERKVSGLILEAPYTSVADVAAMRYPLLPIRLILKDPFHSDWRIGRVTAPVLVMHGEDDDTIPISMGQRLFDLVQAPKRFARFPHAGHLDLDDHGALTVVREFVGSLAGLHASASLP